MKLFSSPAVRRYCRKKSSVIGLLVFAFICLFLLFAPALFHLDPYTADFYAMKHPPSAEHWLGTDNAGRDTFARLVYGGRTSLMIGVASTTIGVLIGIILGLLSGYFRGWLEQLIMRVADIFLSFPSMVLILCAVAVVGSSTSTVVIILGIIGWVSTAKLLYGNVISVRNKEYIESSRAIGTGNFSILFGDIFPNAAAPIWVSLPFRISSAIITESSLSFLGAGVQSPQATWGNMLNAAQDISILSNCPWMWIAPGCCLFVTIICINLIGEGIRDALDPKTN